MCFRLALTPENNILIDMETIYFIIVAIGLYFGADWILRRIEAHLGRRLEHRTIVFMFLLLTSALIVFELIQRFLPK